jgi:hypothetical protein
MTTREQYIESFESGWKLAGKLKSKCKGKPTMEVASAGLCLALAAALTDDDVEEARDAVRKLLLIYGGTTSTKMQARSRSASP